MIAPHQEIIILQGPSDTLGTRRGGGDGVGGVGEATVGVEGYTVHLRHDTRLVTVFLSYLPTLRLRVPGCPALVRRRDTLQRRINGSCLG